MHKLINWLIGLFKVETNKVSDGFHTFEELYEHRTRLYISLAKKALEKQKSVWITEFHSDGSRIKGWFVMGIGKVKGEQITYHLPIKYWNEVIAFAEKLERAPLFDGHSSQDVLERLKNL